MLYVTLYQSNWIESSRICSKNGPPAAGQSSSNQNHFLVSHVSISAEADTSLSFIMKHEIPDNLINMCCISLSVAGLVGGKSRAFVWGASWLIGSDCSGTVGNTHPSERGDISRFDQGLLTDPPEKGKWGSYQGAMTRGQFWCPFSLTAVLLFQDQNLVEQPGKVALRPPSELTGQLRAEMEFKWKLRWSKRLLV